MLRLLDARAGAYAEVRSAHRGLLRVCAHAPEAAGGPDLTGLRVLLTADLLLRAAELLGELQVVTALAFPGHVPEQPTAAERAAEALGIHPPAARVGPGEAQSALGGPPDVHLAGEGASLGQDALVVQIAPARLQPPGEPGAQAPLAGQDPLAVRLALLSRPADQPADLTGGALAEVGQTLGQWRRRVALWAESPSAPIPARIAAEIRAAFGDLDTVAVLGLLRGLAPDEGVPPGARFETFVYADRVLALDLPRDIGRTGS